MMERHSALAPSGGESGMRFKSQWLSVVMLSAITGCYTGSDGSAASGTDSGASGGTPSGSGTQATGGTGDSEDETGEPDAPVDEETLDRIGAAGLRRLTAAEYDATVKYLLDVDVSANLLLPEDWRQPFDNDFSTQVASAALIEGAELLASDVAALALETPARRDLVVGCTPSSATDDVCFRDFIARFGRKALRRPISDEEVDRFAVLISEAEEADDFYTAVDVALRTFLQHPEFLYRVEIGTPVENDPEVFRLNDYEVATRLSYFIWGSTPDEWLLDVADDGGLSDSTDVEAIAAMMLEDERAKERVGRFHALWLGFETLPHSPDLTNAMQAETRALLDKVIFEDRSAWQDLLRSTETFVDDVLAEHYGLPAPGGANWTGYADTGRQGLLSHGTFLSAMGKIDDSSPTKRGILVRSRMMCQIIPPPPPTVDVDNTEPPEGVCKEQFYREVHAQGGCATCHDLVDPIGLGLEMYDHTGAFRTVENDDPSCEISGVGRLDGMAFSGPAELSDLLIESGSLNECVATQLYRFAMGKSEMADADEAFVELVAQTAAPEGDFEFMQMVASFVAQDAFRFRRNELEGEGE